MRLVTLTVNVAPEDLNNAIDGLIDIQTATRQLEACQSYDVYVKRGETEKLYIPHMWANEAAFDAYKASDLFTKTLAALKPLMTAPPQSVTYDVEQVPA